jgi:hypothetical protein
MKIEVNYEYKMKNSYQLHQADGEEWLITIKKNAPIVNKKFDSLCLFEFLELHSEALSPDPIKTLKFVERWGPLNGLPINRVAFTGTELVLRAMWNFSEESSISKLQASFESGPLSEHFKGKLSISVAGRANTLRPVLRPQDLQTAILLSGLLNERQGYVRCHLHEVLGKPRDYDCPIGCWTRTEGRPGRKSRQWGDNRCRSYFNRNKNKYNWS